MRRYSAVMQHIARLSVFLIASVCATHLALADPLYTFGNVSSTFTDNALTLGFAFTANSTFNVTSLGWFDPCNGFQSDHTVGIFDANGTLLVSTTLEAGTSDPLTDGFSFQAITPITLEMGETYTLAGTTGGNLDAFTVNDDVSNFTVNPEFTIGANAALFSYGPDLVDPDSHFSDYLVYAGPNLEGVPGDPPPNDPGPSNAAAPEPASGLLLAFALPALLLARRVKQRCRRSDM